MKAKASRASASLPTADSRVSIDDRADCLFISWPARREAGDIVYDLLWLSVWVVAEFCLIATLLTLFPVQDPGKLLLVSGLFLVWSMGGGMVLLSIGWQLAGREIISIASGTLILRREIFGLGRTRRYDCAGILGLHYSRCQRGYAPRSRAMMEALGQLGHSVAFQHGTRTHRFGVGLDEDEAYEILTPIVAHL